MRFSLLCPLTSDNVIPHQSHSQIKTGACTVSVYQALSQRAWGYQASQNASLTTFYSSDNREQSSNKATPLQRDHSKRSWPAILYLQVEWKGHILIAVPSCNVLNSQYKRQWILFETFGGSSGSWSRRHFGSYPYCIPIPPSLTHTYLSSEYTHHLFEHSTTNPHTDHTHSKPHTFSQRIHTDSA